MTDSSEFKSGEEDGDSAAGERDVADIAIDHARSVETMCVNSGALVSDAAIDWVRAEIFCAVGNERRRGNEKAAFWREHALEWARKHDHMASLFDEAADILSRLVAHCDAMESQHEDYHNPEGPLRSQLLCEAIAFGENIDRTPPEPPASSDPAKEEGRG